MKIMYLLFSFTIGGTERLLVDICNQMVEYEQKVYLYIVNDLYSTELLETVRPEVHIELQKRPVGSGKKIQTIFRVANFIRQNKIDIVHCNSFDAPELLILRDILYKSVKVVHTIHDVGQYKEINVWKRYYRNYICNRFIAISESVKQDIIEYGADQKKVTVVYNAVNLDKFAKGKQKQYNLEDIVIGNVARIDIEKKGQDILVSAIGKLRKEGYNVRCLFAGAADSAHEIDLEKLKEQAEKLKIDKYIDFKGNVNDIPKFLNSIDIFVLPSRFEGFGISLIEALAMGLPCVACDLYGPAEIIGNDERGVLFSTGDDEDLTIKIKKLIEEYQIHLKQATANIDYVYHNFDIKNMCNKLLDVYFSSRRRNDMKIVDYRIWRNID